MFIFMFLLYLYLAAAQVQDKRKNQHSNNKDDNSNSCCRQHVSCSRSVKKRLLHASARVNATAANTARQLDLCARDVGQPGCRCGAARSLPKHCQRLRRNVATAEQVRATQKPQYGRNDSVASEILIKRRPKIALSTIVTLLKTHKSRQQQQQRQ